MSGSAPRPSLPAYRQNRFRRLWADSIWNTSPLAAVPLVAPALTLSLLAATLPGCSAPKRVYRQPPPSIGKAEQSPAATDNATQIKIVPEQEVASDPYQSKGMQAASLAMAQIGQPYQYGGNSPSGFDCSGLVMYVYGLLDVFLPRTAEEQASRGRSVSLTEAAPGDLLFFQIDGRRISHVGIFAGDDVFVHAPGSGSSVQSERVTNDWWRERLVDVRRILP